MTVLKVLRASRCGAVKGSISGSISGVLVIGRCGEGFRVRVRVRVWPCV